VGVGAAKRALCPYIARETWHGLFARR
jgi:hypothetical protein